MKAILTHHIKENRKKYLLFACCLIIGIVLGLMAPRFLNQNVQNELDIFIDDYFSDYKNIKDIDPAELLRNNIFKKLSTYLLIWISGFSVIGAFFMPTYFLFYGFMIGFTNSFVNNAYGINGMLMNFAAFLPQNIIELPALFFAGACVISYSLKHTKTSKGLAKVESTKGLFTVYSVFLLIAFIISIAGCVIESYVTPDLILYFLEKVV